MTTWGEQALELRGRLSGDPFVTRFVERATTQKAPDGGSPRVVSPRDVIGEQRTTSLAIVADVLPVWLAATGKRTDHARYGVLLNAAVPYLIANRIHPLALHYDLPKHIVGDFLPHPLMYLSFEGALPQVVDGKQRGVLDAVLVMRAEGRIDFGLIGTNDYPHTDGDRGWMLVVSVPIGARFPQEVDARAHQFLGLLAFLNSPYVDTNKEWSHKRGAKARWHGRRIGDPVAINVVTLRAKVHEAVLAEAGQGPKWKSRWIVRGHYRAQWYPSLKAHKVIWIAPYIKGPDDAPLEQQFYAAVR